MDKEEAKRILDKAAIRARDTNVPSSFDADNHVGRNGAPILTPEEVEILYSHIWCSLNASENILGEEYDLEQLRQLVQTTQTGRCKACRHSAQPSKLTQLYGEPGTLTCHHGPCNRRNVNENDYCSYFAPKEESAP